VDWKAYWQTVVGLEVTTEGSRTGTGTEIEREMQILGAVAGRGANYTGGRCPVTADGNVRQQNDAVMQTDLQQARSTCRSRQQ